MDRKTKISLGIAAVAAAGALIGGIAALVAHDSGGSNSHDSHNQANVTISGGAGGCIGAGQNVVVNCPSPAPINTDQPDSSIASSIARTARPAAPGPWAFTVLFDEVGGKPLGLYIRSSPDRNGHHIGLALHLTAVWVDCVKVTTFDPDLGTGNGPRWYKVHWPSAERSDAIGRSDPSDPAQGWAYAYYLRPNGTNGQVPACS
jgi:hypothetical protein